MALILVYLVVLKAFKKILHGLVESRLSPSLFQSFFHEINILNPVLQGNAIGPRGSPSHHRKITGDLQRTRILQM